MTWNWCLPLPSEEEEKDEVVLAVRVVPHADGVLVDVKLVVDVVVGR